jgi:peptide/nickel transport system permease protein
MMKVRNSSVKKRSQWQSVWLRFKKNKGAMIGLVIFVILILVAVFADVISNYNGLAIKQNILSRYSAPNKMHLFGTDQYGRDILARIIFGTRISLYVGLITVMSALLMGGTIGAIAGYYGGWIDDTLMRIMDIFLAIPGIILAIAIVAALGQNINNIIIALSISRTPQFARVVRSSVITIKSQEYIEAAHAYGASDTRIIIKYILRNAIGPIIIQATLNMASIVLGISQLSFLGLGIQLPMPEWGSMLSDARQAMRYHPYLVIFPGFAILIAVLSLNLIGDGLRDALDPKLKN